MRVARGVIYLEDAKRVVSGSGDGNRNGGVVVDRTKTGRGTKGAGKNGGADDSGHGLTGGSNLQNAGKGIQEELN